MRPPAPTPPYPVPFAMRVGRDAGAGFKPARRGEPSWSPGEGCGAPVQGPRDYFPDEAKPVSRDVARERVQR